MTQLTSRISSEADLRAHIASYPELYEDLAVDALEDRLEMSNMSAYICCVDIPCVCDDCCVNLPCVAHVDICGCDTFVDEDCTANS